MTTATDTVVRDTFKLGRRSMPDVVGPDGQLTGASKHYLHRQNGSIFEGVTGLELFSDDPSFSLGFDREYEVLITRK